jgi:hypothetical protein
MEDEPRWPGRPLSSADGGRSDEPVTAGRCSSDWGADTLVGAVDDPGERDDVLGPAPPGDAGPEPFFFASFAAFSFSFRCLSSSSRRDWRIASAIISCTPNQPIFLLENKRNRTDLLQILRADHTSRVIRRAEPRDAEQTTDISVPSPLSSAASLSTLLLTCLSRARAGAGTVIGDDLHPAGGNTDGDETVADLAHDDPPGGTSGHSRFHSGEFGFPVGTNLV